jgi:hypothetical protein
MDPLSQKILLASSSSGEEYWIRYSNFATNRFPGGLLLDNDGNIVGSGWIYSGSASIWYPWHWKLNRKGDILNNLVCSDYPTVSIAGAFVTQLPSGGDYIFTNGDWRTRRGTDFTEGSRISGLGGGYITDSSGNSYGGLYSIDSNLNLRWGVAQGGVGYIARRTDGNIILPSNTPSTPGDANLLVFDSSNGSLVSSYKTSGATDHYAQSTAVDSSGNMYWGGGYSISSYGALIYKLNSAGSLLWYYYKYSLGLGVYPSSVIGIDFDSEGNVYIQTGSYLFKLNSSGTPQWCVNIFGSDITFQLNPRAFRIFGSSIYISTRNALLKLPLDVTSIPNGTYGPATFQTVTASLTSDVLPSASWSSYSESQPTYTSPTIGSQFGTFSTSSAFNNIYQF